MTNVEIKELIRCLTKIASDDSYSDGVQASARRRITQLESQLEPEEPEVAGINKWFKTK
jgi:hypothetical protein